MLISITFCTTAITREVVHHWDIRPLDENCLLPQRDAGRSTHVPSSDIPQVCAKISCESQSTVTMNKPFLYKNVSRLWRKDLGQSIFWVRIDLFGKSWIFYRVLERNSRLWKFIFDIGYCYLPGLWIISITRMKQWDIIVYPTWSNWILRDYIWRWIFFGLFNPYCRLR